MLKIAPLTEFVPLIIVPDNVLNVLPIMLQTLPSVILRIVTPQVYNSPTPSKVFLITLVIVIALLILF